MDQERHTSAASKTFFKGVVAFTLITHAARKTITRCMSVSFHGAPQKRDRADADFGSGG